QQQRMERSEPRSMQQRMPQSEPRSMPQSEPRMHQSEPRMMPRSEPHVQRSEPRMQQPAMQPHGDRGPSSGAMHGAGPQSYGAPAYGGPVQDHGGGGGGHGRH